MPHLGCECHFSDALFMVRRSRGARVGNVVPYRAVPSPSLSHRDIRPPHQTRAPRHRATAWSSARLSRGGLAAGPVGKTYISTGLRVFRLCLLWGDVADGGVDAPPIVITFDVGEQRDRGILSGTDGSNPPSSGDESGSRQNAGAVGRNPLSPVSSRAAGAKAGRSPRIETRGV
jgi:hypothetical protein